MAHITCKKVLFCHLLFLIYILRSVCRILGGKAVGGSNGLLPRIYIALDNGNTRPQAVVV